MARYIFVTGGVVSSLGKGLSSASLAYLLQSRGYKVRIRKLDPYLNVDPGTMSPFQHGEVFVTDDGAETDLDLGHYERFSGILANLALVITIGLIIAIASATQDITVDALRIEQIGEHEGQSMQAGAAMSVVGWWTGYKLGGVVALNSAEFFQKAGFENYWQVTFLILGILIIGCNIVYYVRK